jgi:predicted N-acyltransferase
LKTSVFDRLSEVPAATWNSLLAGQATVYGTDFWGVIEDSGLNDIHCRYILVSDDDGNPIAAAGFYTITTDIAIFAPRWLRRLLIGVRRLMPGFLRVRILECGTPITLVSRPYAARPGADDSAIIVALHDVLMRVARAEGHFLVLWRDFEASAAGLRPALERLGYHWAAGMPNTYVDIRWDSVEEYLSALKSYYRSKLLRHLRINREAQVSCRLVDDFAALADTMCRQWFVVHNQADEFEREVLTPAFYREFSARLGARSRALLFYRGEDMVGHALLYLDGDMLRWLYFGRNEARNDSLYILVAYSVIEAAIALGAKRVEMGITTYPVKQDVGARIEQTHIAVRARSGFINRFVGAVYPLLNSPPSVRDREVFKQSLAAAESAAHGQRHRMFRAGSQNR